MIEKKKKEKRNPLRFIVPSDSLRQSPSRSSLAENLRIPKPLKSAQSDRAGVEND